MPVFSVNILTLFPEMFPGFLNYSLAGQALQRGIWDLNVIDVRSFANDKHANVDDTPYGGGHGMVMRADVVGNAVDSVLSSNPNTKLIYVTPSGKKFDSSIAKELASLSNITILCGRYKGIDQRIIDFYRFYELSIGDYILSGGEPAAMVLLDACIRLVPGVIKNNNSIINESFYNNMLECPQYTKPFKWKDCSVPEILLSGNHQKINKWRQNKSMLITKQRRPDLLNNLNGDKND